MSETKEILNQRRHARFRVPRDAFAALGPDYSKVGQIINISMSGLAFRYHRSEGPLNASELDIFLAGRAFYLYKLPFETVRDSTTNEAPFSSMNMKVSALQFGDLTDNQKSNLRHFIQTHTTADPEA